MRVFHSVLSVTILRASYQVLPTRPNSLFTELLHVSLGLPISLGVYCRAYFSIAPSSFLKVCPIHSLIWIRSWSFSFRRSSLDVLSYPQEYRVPNYSLPLYPNVSLFIKLTFSILLNIMYHALMGRFQLELFIFIVYVSTVVPLTSCVSFTVGLSSLTRHFQQVL